MKHILIIAGDSPSLINFRLPLIKKLISKGHKISIATPIEKFTKALRQKLINLSVKVYTYSLSRTGINVFKDFNSIFEIFKIIRISKPSVVISFTVKPVIYTGLVLRLFKKKINYFPLITGVGYGLYEKNSIKHKLLKLLIVILYREGLKSSKKVIFQNRDDQSLFLILA